MLTEEVGLDFDGKGPFVGERRITTKNLAKCQGYEDRTTPEADEGWPESSGWAGGGGGRADWLTRINRPRPALTEPSRKKDEPYCPFNLPGDKGQTLVNFRGGSYGFCRYGGHKGGGWPDTAGGQWLPIILSGLSLPSPDYPLCPV